MLKKIKNIALKTDRFLYKKFGSDKSTKPLENIREAQIIFSYLNQIGGENEVRFVGGCVRKAICGENIDDIDLATSLKPTEVKEKLNKQDIKVIDSGISHGTVTAILNNKKFEITTLRKDISTDGRHANVEFTSNWEEDASRRDFTINAIYSDIEGRIFDPLGGISDLKNGKIKFIGSADERIQEDYLRILRYFRFYTQYSKIDHDQNIIQTIKKNINERILDEIKKILLLENLQKLFHDEKLKEIILNIFPQFKYYERLDNIYKLNKRLRSRYDCDIILALLILDESKDYEYFCYKYKTSNKTKDRFKNILKNLDSFRNKKFYSQENIKKLIYLTDRESVKDLLLFSLGINNKLKTLEFEQLIEYLDICKLPKFPISGEDLKKYGYKTGKELGKKLESLEEQWIKNNFVIDKKELEKSLQKKI